MQPLVVNNFRARLRNNGYTEISICRYDRDFWLVSALDPLGGFKISVIMSFNDMFLWR